MCSFNQSSSWGFLILCFFLGVLAEQAFLHGMIGISYPLFVSVLYCAILWRFSKSKFTHLRQGILFFICIWMLALSFFVYTNPLFYLLNMLALPLLIVVHLVLITSPKWLEWHGWTFMALVLNKIGAAIRYDLRFLSVLSKKMKQRMNENTFAISKKIFLGLLIAAPILFVVIALLGSADEKFAVLLGNIPGTIFNGTIVEGGLRGFAVIIYTILIFGFLQVLREKSIIVKDKKMVGKSPSWDGVIILPAIILMNMIYVLFTIVQFQYFFSGSLQEGFTYAEYARRGFFELLMVTMLNLSIIVGVLSYVKKQGKTIYFIRILLTFLVFFSGVMLSSAFIRLFLYEEAYGFTLARVLPHSFMIFLMVIFCYTLIKIWLDRLSLFHFYVLASLLYYTLLNIVNIDGFIVEQNLKRFENTGKIDVYYLDSLSYTGLSGLMDLYSSNPDHPELKEILKNRQLIERKKEESWQSYNLTKDKVVDRLEKLSLN